MSIDFVPAEDYRDEVKALYKSAFPKEEQAPFRLLFKRERQEIADFYAVVDEGEFVGLTLLTGLDDVVTLFFFAIDDNLRGHGYGTEVLTALKDKYDGKRIFICIEPIEKDAPNYKQRVKRKAFYKKNGFKVMPFQVGALHVQPRVAIVLIDCNNLPSLLLAVGFQHIPLVGDAGALPLLVIVLA